jgi:addiction module HigA family antidote
MTDETEVRKDSWLRRNPPHPGESIREGCMEEMTIGEAARKLGVSRNTLSRVLNGRCGISPEMALKLEAVGWSNAEFWVRRQAHYDLAQARKRLAAKTKAA